MFLIGFMCGMFVIVILWIWPNKKKSKPVSKKTWKDDDQNWRKL